MRLPNEIRLITLFTLALIVFCCSAGRARAEFTDPDHSESVATPGQFEEQAPDEKEGVDDHDTEDDDLEGDEQGAGILLMATPGSYVEAKDEQAAVARSLGYAVYSTDPAVLSLSGSVDSDSNNLECETLEAHAVLTGPDTLEIYLTAATEPMHFYGFELDRNESMDMQRLFMDDPDVRVSLPDYSTGTTAPVVDSVLMGTVEILSTNIKRLRYGENRMLEICWTISGTEDAADFGEGLTEDTLFLNLGGKYVLPGGGGEDFCSHHGPVEVPGLSAAVRQAACPHTVRLYAPLDDLTHSAVCEACGYVFENEAHRIETGRCMDCGYEVIVSGDIDHVLNGRTVTESYTGVEENLYIPRFFTGYLAPDPVLIPKGGGKLTVYHDPIRYRLLTEEEEYTLYYDESLLLTGGTRKGFVFDGYKVVDVVSP